MPPQSHDTLLRDVCSALAEHDLATLHILLAPEVVCHLPGCGAEEGDYRGFEEVFGLWTRVSQRSTCGLEVAVEDVLSSARYAVALCRYKVQRGGEQLEGRAVVVIRSVEARVAEGWLYLFEH